MTACYPASFHGEGEANPYFMCFGHPIKRMTHVAIDGSLKDIGTGFVECFGHPTHQIMCVAINGSLPENIGT